MRNNNLEMACENYLQEVIKKSWTWAKLTEEEKFNFLYLLNFDKIKGTAKNRIEVLHLVYHAFLVGLGYQPINWREENENGII